MTTITKTSNVDYTPLFDKMSETTAEKHSRINLEADDAPRRGCLYRVAKNAQKVALPLASVAMTTSMPSEEGGSIAYGACVVAYGSVIFLLLQ